MGVGLGLATSCSKSSEPVPDRDGFFRPEPLRAPPATDSSQRARQGLLAFSLNLHRATSRTGNQVLSPTSIAIGLLMLRHGAAGAAANAIDEALGIRALDETTAVASDWLLRWATLSPPQHLPDAEPPLVRVGARTYVDDRVELTDAFAATTRDAFGARAERLSFRFDPEGARRTMNSWVESATDGQIVGLYPPGSVTPRTRLVLVTTAAFGAGWAALTVRDGSMSFAAPHGPVDAERLSCRNCGVRYGKLPEAEFIRIAYVGWDFGLVVIVPDQTSSLAELEASLSVTDLERALTGGDAEYLNLQFPAFSVAPKQQTLDASLKHLGLEALWSAADWSGLATGATLELNRVIHQATIEVDELGTRAAAATGLEFVERGTAKALPRDFVVDRPFLFVVGDRVTGAALFIGRVEDPTR